MTKKCLIGFEVNIFNNHNEITQATFKVKSNMYTYEFNTKEAPKTLTKNCVE